VHDKDDLEKALVCGVNEDRVVKGIASVGDFIRSFRLD
jgi:hypothetical protein